MKIIQSDASLIICITFTIIFIPKVVSENLNLSHDPGTNFSDLSFQEKNVIEMVKEILGNDWLYRDYMKTNKYLVRWVRDGNLNPQKAADKIKKFHTFRKENDMENIVNEDWTELEKKFEYEALHGMKNINDGAPILLINLGKWDARKAVLAGKNDLEKMYRYIHYILEKADVYVRNSVSINGTAIINLAGFSLRTHACLACLPVFPYIVTTLENHYPQIIKHLFLINTPRIFHPIIDIVLPLVSPYTSKVYSVFGYDKSEWAPAIMEKIPGSVLPIEFGGTRTKTRS